ncbi:thioredoxin domain-containing protein [Arthrobacter sp. H20]|uniref:DsbA family protein n=1 Tax=Arthrobacter sp. H20 TaxID=1267981 RepID=UPI00047CACD2|nr:thioredoxin domain-containing protein [Arthrobacter sp. H20]
MTPSSSRKPSKSQRSAQAREQARLIREAQERQEKRKGLLIRWGVVAAVVAILVVVGLIVVNTVRGQVPDAGPAPAGGNEHGGIVLTSSTEVESFETGTVDLGSLPSEPRAAGELPPGIAAAASEPVQVVSYVDVNCVFCAEFESTHADQIQEWLDAGEITMEHRNLAYLDRNSSTDYSSRGANALACVAEESPEAYFDYSAGLFANYENGELDDDGLATLASSVGAVDISTCLSESTFRPWVNFTTAAAELDGISGTPTIYVDGEAVPEAIDNFAEFTQEKIDAKG